MPRYWSFEHVISGYPWCTSLRSTVGPVDRIYSIFDPVMSDTASVPSSQQGLERFIREQRNSKLTAKNRLPHSNSYKVLFFAIVAATVMLLALTFSPLLNARIAYYLYSSILYTSQTTSLLLHSLPKNTKTSCVLDTLHLNLYCIYV